MASETENKLILTDHCSMKGMYSIFSTYCVYKLSILTKVCIITIDYQSSQLIALDLLVFVFLMRKSRVVAVIVTIPGSGCQINKSVEIGIAWIGRFSFL